MIHHWDFFGPDSAKTAEHFRKHLFEFASSQNFTIQADGMFKAEVHHTCFWVEMNSDEASLETKNRLRPRRSLTRAEHEILLEQINRPLA